MKFDSYSCFYNYDLNKVIYGILVVLFIKRIGFLFLLFLNLIFNLIIVMYIKLKKKNLEEIFNKFIIVN